MNLQMRSFICFIPYLRDKNAAAPANQKGKHDGPSCRQYLGIVLLTTHTAQFFVYQRTILHGCQKKLPNRPEDIQKAKRTTLMGLEPTTFGEQSM
jgi:hypothetical protein